MSKVSLTSTPAAPLPKLRPFLRWAGGKQQIVKSLLQAMPTSGFNTYWEPFLGAGSLFFAATPKRAVLSDANTHLIDCYTQVRACHTCVSKYLDAHARRNSESHYYSVRTTYNSAESSPAQAARFIYLNKTCFNGIFRVNEKGSFNVPYGHKNPPCLPTLENLGEVRVALTSAKLKSGNYADILADAKRDDFVYLDPPYPPLTETAYFTHYTAGRFNPQDQVQLADTFCSLDKRGCKLLMSNADTSAVRKLYKGFNIRPLSVTRFLTCKKKHTVRELLISNYG
jgi:DNA adenine methylase